jgi:branched-chain amino acid transport system permease protein
MRAAIKEPDAGAARVTRSRRTAGWTWVTGIIALAVVAVFAILPYVAYSGTTAILGQAFVILTLACMWNLLAGYAGLVSVGQQGFVGLGAYFVLIGALHGISPFLGIPVAAVGSGLAALPLWLLVSRLRTAYFAIGTWVLATVVELFVTQFQSIGGGTGERLPGLDAFGSTLLSAYTYWAGLAVTVLALGGMYVLLRSRVGLVLTAIRDDERAARSCGARVGLARMLVFVVAAVGCGAAGAVLAIQNLGVNPGVGGVFAIQWTADMAFAVIIGGIGTIEGPIIGTIVFMVLQQTLQQYNVLYLIALGATGIVIALFARRGLWGLADQHLGLRLFPVGYHLWPAGARAASPPRIARSHRKA